MTDLERNTCGSERPKYSPAPRSGNAFAGRVRRNSGIAASDCSVWVVRPMSSWPRRTKVARREILASEQWLPALIYRSRLSEGCQPAKMLEATTRPVESQETGFP
jgi:hypothetical protein